MDQTSRIHKSFWMANGIDISEDGQDINESLVDRVFGAVAP